MGLYQSELSKQIFLRNKQKKEWEMMKKNIAHAEEKKREEKSVEQKRIEKEQQEEDLLEINETQSSKKLTAAMVKSSLEKNDDTLQRAVDVIQNQNGIFIYTCNFFSSFTRNTQRHLHKLKQTNICRIIREVKVGFMELQNDFYPKWKYITFF